MEIRRLTAVPEFAAKRIVDIGDLALDEDHTVTVGNASTAALRSEYCKQLDAVVLADVIRKVYTMKFRNRVKGKNHFRWRC